MPPRATGVALSDHPTVSRFRIAVMLLNALTPGLATLPEVMSRADERAETQVYEARVRACSDDTKRKPDRTRQGRAAGKQVQTSPFPPAGPGTRAGVVRDQGLASNSAAARSKNRARIAGPSIMISCSAPG